MNFQVILFLLISIVFSKQIVIKAPSSSLPISTQDIVNCGKPDDTFELTLIAINPDPPQRGAQLVIEIAGILKQPLLQG